jgi:methionine-rich copper-binding protein CopC
MKLLAAAAFLAGSPACAWAHAALTSAAPGVGAVVGSAPSEVAIEFDAELADGSAITVHDGDGKQVDDGHPHLAGADRRRLAVGLTTPQPGTFRVDWHAIDKESHKTQGHYAFRVAK